jgi:hypothetical protein
MALFPLGILSAAGGGVVEGDYELIQTQILGSATSSVTFSNLGNFSSTYKHLQMRMTVRTDGSIFEGYVRLNGDTGNNYAYHQLVGTGSSVISGSATGISGMSLFANAVSASPANSFGVSVFDLLDAYSTTKNTTARASMGIGAEFIYLRSGLWLNTASITSIQLLINGSGNFVAGSRFSLYGIRG